MDKEDKDVMDKEDATEYFSAIKKNETICNNTDAPRGYHAK